MRGKDDKNRLGYWFPRIEAAGLPVPKTKIIPATDEQCETLCNMLGGAVTETAQLTALIDKIKLAGDELGWPCFLRTDFTSAKHSWKKTCFLPNSDNIRKHVYRIAEFSENADFFGLPYDVWVVREALKTRPLFYAFQGIMPIVREFRFFMRDGKREHVQPYWPPASIDRPDDEKWREKLNTASRPSDEELLHLTALSQKANEAVPGFWSIDWLETVDRGWVLTDMAEGVHSYRYDPSKPDVEE